MKKYLIICLTIMTVFIGVFFAYLHHKDSPINNIKKISEDLTSYEIEGTLSFVDEESLKKINVTSIYKKIDTQDFFYVRLEDSSTKQVQTIIRNQEGVFVISHGFNRAFKFNTDWPFNGFKPYILQNIFEALLEHQITENIRDGYILVSPIRDDIYKEYHEIQVMFNQNNALQQVNILDQNKTEKMAFTLCTYILNSDIDESIFVVKNDDSSQVSLNEQIPIFPLESYNSELVDHLKTNNGHILRYKGDKYFTLVEKIVSKNTTFSIEEADGDFYLGEEGFLIIGENIISLFKDGIETKIYSNDLTQEEKQNVLLSIENYVVIEE